MKYQARYATSGHAQLLCTYWKSLPFNGMDKEGVA